VNRLLPAFSTGYSWMADAQLLFGPLMLSDVARIASIVRNYSVKNKTSAGRLHHCGKYWLEEIESINFAQGSL